MEKILLKSMPKKRICLLGIFKRRDEGLNNVNYYLSKELTKGYSILALDTKEIFGKNFWRRLINFKPGIIHYLCGPTIRSLFITKVLGSYFRVKTVISAIHPMLPSFFKPLVRIFRPDLILVQSQGAREMFRDLGCKTEFLPNGVDVKRFAPVSDITKMSLRTKFGIDPKKFIILHVGHLTRVRNLEILNRMQKDRNQVIIVVSGCLKKDRNLYNSLKQKGCLIWDRYFENIEEIYAVADCYVFPVKKGDSIQMPLSVMEAMACNLPVITTKFEGLTETFEDGDGLFFAEREEDFLRSLEIVKEGRNVVKTREKILPYSWVNIVDKLEQVYAELF